MNQQVHPLAAFVAIFLTTFVGTLGVLAALALFGA
jgi:hypothetical protein